MHLLAVSTGVAIAYGIGLWAAVIVTPITITILKRQWLLLIGGLVTIGLVWWIACFRLADPASWWARRFYGEGKLARARQRYGVSNA